MPEPAERSAKPVRTWRPMILWTAAILLALGLAWFVGAVALPLVKAKIRMHTLLAFPVTSGASGEDPFFSALADLVKAQRLDPDEYVCYPYDPVYPHDRRAKSGIRRLRFNQARAAELSSGGRTYVVVILEHRPPIHPGGAVEQLVLMDTAGRILDKFFCVHADPLATKLLNPPDQDGAQLAIVVGIPSPLHRLRIENGRLKLLTPPPAESHSGVPQEAPK